MAIKFSEDVVPLTDLKVNPGKVVKHVAKAHRPTLLTVAAAGWLLCSPLAILRRRRKSAPLCVP